MDIQITNELLVECYQKGINPNGTSLSPEQKRLLGAQVHDITRADALVFLENNLRVNAEIAITNAIAPSEDYHYGAT